MSHQLSKQQRRVIADAIGLIVNEAGAAWRDLYANPTIQEASLCEQKIRKQIDYLQSAISVSSNAIFSGDPAYPFPSFFHGLQKKDARPKTQMEREIEDRVQDEV